jgi:xylulokinase
MKKLFGVDFGTGGCKATVIDLEGNILASAFQEYPSEHKKPGWTRPFGLRHLSIPLLPAGRR